MSRLAETPKVLSSSIDAEDHAREAIVRPTLAPQIDMPGLGTTVVMTAALRGALAVRCLAFESGLAAIEEVPTSVASNLTTLGC